MNKRNNHRLGLMEAIRESILKEAHRSTEFPIRP
jgi:hypothetical protein